MAGKLVEVTDGSFDSAVKENKVLLVDFWAPWCGPCRRLNPILEELSKEMDGKVTFAKLNTDENVNTATRFGIMSIPTMLVFKNGEKVDALIGAHPKENIVASLSRHL
ncbi:MAG TPA: thioredoxin [Candidatus Thermoplasmatota archaeon]|nr:thioredoxin [Candidatus Thermoplasmatota archaeon]